MTKIAKQSLKLRAKRLSNKLTVKRMRLTVCDECTSSSDEDQWPILPSSSSSEDQSELSPIEEEKSVETSSGSSNYLSSFLESSVTTISSMSEDDESSYKPLRNVVTAVNNDPRPLRVNLDEPAVSEQCQNVSSNSSTNNSAVVNVDEIGFEPLARQVVREETYRERFTPTYVTLSPSTCEFNDIHRSKNFTFLLMTFALICSNGNQLRYLMDSQEHLKFFFISLGLIIASCVFQLIVKTFSFISYCFSVRTNEGIRRIKCLNTVIVLFALLTTVVNVGLSVVLLLEYYDIIPL